MERTAGSAVRSAPPLRMVARLAAAELVGTALLLTVGLSLVILDFGAGSPVVRLLPSAAIRRLVTGFFFGGIGATIAVSPLGKVSGGHINPVVTLAFWFRRQLHRRHAVAYILAQCVGAILGGWPLLAWGAMGRSVGYGVTVPGPDGAWAAVTGEAATTFALIALLFYFLGGKRRRAYTPLLFPVLYMILVWAEAPLSGTSTNPARSLGSAVIAADWRGFWIYLAGPLVGMALALVLHATFAARRQ